MSELTDLFIQLADRWGWEMLIFAFLLYQFYWPAWLHPSRTKLQAALAKFHVLGIVVEAVAEEMENIDEEEVHDVFRDNGYSPEDFKTGSREAKIRMDKNNP
jgi:hypothetical protein